MPYYIQKRDESNVVVTIEEYEDSKESYQAAREYGLRDPTARYYVAKKPCRAWLESRSPITNPVPLRGADA